MDTKKELLSKLDKLVEEYTALSSVDNKIKGKRIGISSVVFDDKEVKAGLRTMLSNWISQGPNVRAFEEAFAKYIGVKHGIACNSGSSANLLAISAAIEVGDLKLGDEVVVPATTFPTVASPIIQAGCIPVYVDVDIDTYNISPSAIKNAITENTKWLMPVHTFGNPASMDEIMNIVAENGLKVIEDCCEAHGSSIRDKKAGGFGTISTSSFFVAHNMTTGEGGMILTNSDSYMKMCRSLREFGRVDQADVIENRFYSDDLLKDYDRRYVFEHLGYNLRMTDIIASFGIEQLKKLDDLNGMRRKNADYYTSRLKKFAKYIKLPFVPKDFVHTYYGYPMMVRPESGVERIKLVRFLEAHNIETRPIFAGCLPDQPAFRNKPQRIGGDIKNARIIRDNAFFIGVHPGLTQDNIDYVCDVFEKFFKSL